MAKGSFIISNIHYSGCFHNSSLLENLLALFSFSFLFAPLVKLMKTKEAPFPMWEQLKGNEVILYTCVISVYNSKNNIYFTWSVGISVTLSSPIYSPVYVTMHTVL